LGAQNQLTLVAYDRDELKILGGVAKNVYESENCISDAGDIEFGG
jgi:hypothetical protein